MDYQETVDGAIAFGPGRRKLVKIAGIVRNREGNIETGRFASLRPDEIGTVALDPTARLHAEGVTYKFTGKKDGSFRAKRRE